MKAIIRLAGQASGDGRVPRAVQMVQERHPMTEVYPMQPMELRRIELLSGLATLVLGVVLPGYAVLFTPYLPGQHLGIGAAFFLSAIPAVLVGMAAWFDSRYYRLDASIGGGLALVWCGTGLLCAIAFFVPSAFVPYTLPQAVLALISALSGSWAQLQIGRQA